MSQQPQFTFTVPAARRSFGGKALWLVGIGLLANAAAMYFRGQNGAEIILDQKAVAQAQVASPAGQPLGARGIFMMPAQLGPNTYGLYLMDVDSGTICVYRANPDNSHFRLMASRSFKYDRFLEDFNNEPLRPREVQKLVEDQQQRKTLQDKDSVPTVEQVPKADENLPTPAGGPR